MKPTVTPEMLYNNADFTEVKHMGMLEGMHRLIWLLDDAKRVENDKPMLERNDELINAQGRAIEHWRGIIAMVTKLKEK